jgi:hypothetical protein
MSDLERVGRQARGKVRRFVQARTNIEDVEARAARRQGECNRCGECCKILFRCPFLATDASGEYSCRIYRWRFASCRHFPVDPRDLLEVVNCSFSFGPDPLVVGDEPGAQPQPAAL